MNEQTSEVELETYIYIYIVKFSIVRTGVVPHHRNSGSYTRPKPLRNWSSFAVENNWLRPHPPERSSKIGIWIEKFRCQNSNLNLPTIKNGFTVIRILNIRYISWNGSAHSFGIVGSYRSRRYAWIVLQRKTHGEPVRNVHILFSRSGVVWTLIELAGQVDDRLVR